MSAKHTRGFLAVVKAPTKERPHRYISESGATKQEALIALAKTLASLGVNAVDDIDVIPLETA